jgi:hypothetical protein
MKRLKSILDFSGPTLNKEKNLLNLKENLQTIKFRKSLILKENFAQKKMERTSLLLTKKVLTLLH